MPHAPTMLTESYEAMLSRFTDADFNEPLLSRLEVTSFKEMCKKVSRDLVRKDKVMYVLKAIQGMLASQKLGDIIYIRNHYEALKHFSDLDIASIKAVRWDSNKAKNYA